MRPSRLHHHAYVSRDMEATRRFYEEVVGLPLVATWCEEEGVEPYCHTFFELGDGSCLAFFHFAKPETTAAHAGVASTSPYDHVALAATADLQARVAERAKQAGLESLTIDHGYCVSLYLEDPDGLCLELAVDDPRAVAAAPRMRGQAHAELARWLGGDHRPNNDFRAERAG